MICGAGGLIWFSTGSADPLGLQPADRVRETLQRRVDLYWRGQVPRVRVRHPHAAHPGASRGLQARRRILENDAGLGRDAESLRGQQEQVGRRLPKLHFVAGDLDVEPAHQRGLGQCDLGLTPEAGRRQGARQSFGGRPIKQCHRARHRDDIAAQGLESHGIEGDNEFVEWTLSGHTPLPLQPSPRAGAVPRHPRAVLGSISCP